MKYVLLSVLVFAVAACAEEIVFDDELDESAEKPETDPEPGVSSVPSGTSAQCSMYKVTVIDGVEVPVECEVSIVPDKGRPPEAKGRADEEIFSVTNLGELDVPTRDGAE